MAQNTSGRGRDFAPETLDPRLSPASGGNPSLSESIPIELDGSAEPASEEAVARRDELTGEYYLG